MPSIAQTVLNKYNGIPDESAVKSAKVIKTPIIMSPAQLETKAVLANTLKVGIWTVEFTKVDGSKAIMECTLDPRLLPQSKTELNPSAPTTGAASAAEHLLHVYAVDRQGWRSFVVANVIKVYKNVENQ